MSYLFTSQRDLPSFRHLQAEPLSGALGATIRGVKLADDLKQDVIDEIYAALLEFKVLFFRDQEMTDSQHLRLARKFGMPQGPGSIPQVSGYPMIRLQRMDEYQSIGGDVNYHTDDSFRDYPSRMSILRGLTMPLGGGNTIWCDMEKAYASLSEPMKSFLEGLTAEHSLAKNFGAGILESGGAKAYEDMMKRNPPVRHPVIRVHPETGRKCLYVNQMTAARILELNKDESDALLDMLLEHSYQAENECRFFWRDNSVAIWDNRCTQHRGINDFSPAFRLMHRIPIIDDRRPSLTPETEPRLAYDKNADFVRVEELFVNKPELTYPVAGESAATGGSHDSQEESGNGVAQPTDEYAVEVDPKLLAKLNRNRHGLVFTPGAAAQLKRIPAMFRGAAISAVITEARELGSSEVNLAVLDAVQAKRRGG
ncbi:TauD/TfdA family dioxygenase [Candidatus Foliamicus sp.]